MEGLWAALAASVSTRGVAIIPTSSSKPLFVRCALFERRTGRSEIHKPLSGDDGFNQNLRLLCNFKSEAHEATSGDDHIKPDLNISSDIIWCL